MANQTVATDPTLFALQIDQLNKRIDEQEARNIERLAAAKEAVTSAFASSQNAITKADIANEKRFEAVNEFRATLTDQNREFVRSIEYNAQYGSILEKISSLQNVVTEIDTTVRNKVSSVASGPAFMISILSILVGVIIAIITGAIQLGSLQTHVAIDTDNVKLLQADETKRIVEHAGENVERGNLLTRQGINDKRIERLEEYGRIAPPDVASLIERIAKLEIEVKNGVPNK